MANVIEVTTFEVEANALSVAKAFAKLPAAVSDAAFTALTNAQSNSIVRFAVADKGQAELVVKIIDSTTKAEWRVPSDTRFGMAHTVIRDGGNFSCSCENFTLGGNPHCKHIARIMRAVASGNDRAYRA